MAHGLTCDESADCTQCKLRQLACTHRYCPDSPSSKDDCLNSNCHYVHGDYKPSYPDDPQWIVLPGRLPGYLSRERTGDLVMSFAECDTAEERSDRQETGLTVLKEAVNVGSGTYETLHGSCDCNILGDLRA